MEPLSLRKMSDVDVIFCRNMLIYFDEISCRQADESLFDRLTPGGFLCPGPSESMSRISTLFLPRNFGGTVVYQKPFQASHGIVAVTGKCVHQIEFSDGCHPVDRRCGVDAWRWHKYGQGLAHKRFSLPGLSH
jgi:hypothetical protein